MKRLYVILSWLAVLLLWGCAASAWISPAAWGRLWGLVGLSFPFWVAAVLVMLVLGLLFRLKAVLIPLIGLAGCFLTIRDYCPINLSSPHPKGSLMILSYNTLGMGNRAMDPDGQFTVLRYVCSQRPDIACLQETYTYVAGDTAVVQKTMRRYGYHYSRLKIGENAISVVSRYPIVRAEILTRSSANGAGVWYLVPPHTRDTLIVVNCHLESMHLTKEDRSQYHALVRNPEDAEEVKGKRTLVRKISTAGVIRALQADTVAAFLDRHKGRKVILCGDFNDTPVSYAHHQICSRLTDAYRATGNGIGRSFNKDAIYVRIDNIFCSSHWKPFSAFVDNEVPFSDHYPIIAWLKPVKRAGK